MAKQANNKKTIGQSTKSAASGCFVNSASAAYRYYANNESARSKAVARFETRVTTITENTRKPASAKKTSRRSA